MSSSHTRSHSEKNSSRGVRSSEYGTAGPVHSPIISDQAQPTCTTKMPIVHPSFTQQVQWHHTQPVCVKVITYSLPTHLQRYTVSQTVRERERERERERSSVHVGQQQGAPATCPVFKYHKSEHSGESITCLHTVSHIHHK